MFSRHKNSFTAVCMLLLFFMIASLNMPLSSRPFQTCVGNLFKFILLFCVQNNFGQTDLHIKSDGTGCDGDFPKFLQNFICFIRCFSFLRFVRRQPFASNKDEFCFAGRAHILVFVSHLGFREKR